MKMRITKADVKALSENQKHSLIELWRPEKYDIAMASICTDVENDQYDEFEFVVGHIEIDDYARMFLYDIKFAPADTEKDNAEEEADNSLNMETEAIEEDSDENEDDYMDEEQEETEEDDFFMEYSRPMFFNKKDCLPLLNIGQLIELLHRSGFDNCDFNLAAGNGEIGCELGNENINWDSFRDYEPKELCDVLWELVKSLLN